MAEEQMSLYLVTGQWSMCKWGSDPANGSRQVEGTPTLLLGNMWIYYLHTPEKW